MADIAYGFIAENEGLRFYNEQAVINIGFEVLNADDDSAFDFTDDSGSYFMYIYDERSGRLLKSFTSQITRTSNVLIMNTSVLDMTFEDNGTYYFELGYIRSGGYEEILRYGPLEII